MDHYYLDRILPLIFFLVTAGAVCGPLTAYIWLRHKRAAAELELKRDLAARGMSSDEICAVVQASAWGKSIQEHVTEARLI
jgi:hypothetical protein